MEIRIKKNESDSDSLFTVSAGGMKNDALGADEALFVVATAIIAGEVHPFLKPETRARRRFEVGDRVRWGETEGTVADSGDITALLKFTSGGKWAFRQDNGKFNSETRGIGPAAEVIP